MRLATLLAVLVLASITDAFAQELPLQPGQLVQVTCAQAELDNTKAVVVALRRDTLTLQYERFRVDAHRRPHKDTLVTETPVAAMTRLAVHAGRKSGRKTGILVGGTTMFFFGLIGYADYYSSGEEGYARYVFGGAVAAGAIGAGIGWLIGSAIKSDKWEELPLDHLRVSVVPSRNGVGLGARIAF